MTAAATFRSVAPARRPVVRADPVAAVPVVSSTTSPYSHPYQSLVTVTFTTGLVSASSGSTTLAGK